MAISDLTDIIAPPKMPNDTGVRDEWATIEAIVGCALPTDYRDFAVAYGSGRFCNGFIRVFNPFSSQYKKWLDERIYELGKIKEMGELEDYQVFPKKNGLLCWGSDENGNLLCWMTKGKTVTWPVVIVQHSGGTQKIKSQLTTFLGHAFANRIKVDAWSEPFTDDELNFKPL